jgi:hypothetical protein
MSLTLICLSFFMTLVIAFMSAFFASKRNPNAEALWVFTIITFIINSFAGAIALAIPGNYFVTMLNFVFQYNILLAILAFFWFRTKQHWTWWAGGVCLLQVVFSWLMLAFGASHDVFHIMIFAFHQIEMVVLIFASFYYILQSTFDPHKQEVLQR